VEAETVALQPLGVRDGVGEHKTVLAHQHAQLGPRAHQRERLRFRQPTVCGALGICSDHGRVAVRVRCDRSPEGRIDSEIDLDFVPMVHALELLSQAEKLDPFGVIFADVAEYEPLAVREGLDPTAVDVNGVPLPHDRPVFYVGDVVRGCVRIIPSARLAARRAGFGDAAPAQVEGAQAR
jgi:hypothetical protein